MHWRQPRLDAPDVLQHVMARGIERRKIFLDDKDRASFLERLALTLILEETQIQCYAWALIPNHFHILLRTGSTPLSKAMRRLMTGYAVTFTKRHKRSGHLFQNRYKSVVCEEDSYLLELIRYIHLNPLRAKLVQDLKELDKYPWTGHSTILGRCKNALVHALPSQSNRCNEGTPSANTVNPAVAPVEGTGVKKEKPLAEKTIEDVLLHFGETKRVARRRYRNFVKKGIAQGTREDLQGGGLVRSAGGNKAGLLGRQKEEREKGDARILGSDEFVNDTLIKAGEEWEKRQGDKITLPDLVEKVAFHQDLNTENIFSASRKKAISEARALVCHFAIHDFNYSVSEVARYLAISRVNAARCADREKKALDMYGDLKDIVQ